MATLRDIRRRINSVKSTQQITRAMKMVAAAKMRRAQDRLFSTRPYAERLDELLGDVAASAQSSKHPLLQTREVHRAICLMVTSDRGLCGSFNANALRRGQTEIDELAGSAEVEIVAVGSKAAQYFRRRDYRLREKHEGILDTLTFEQTQAISRDIQHQYAAQKVDRVFAIYNKFVSTGVQEVTVEQLLPIAAQEAPKEQEGKYESPGYIYEPSAQGILDVICPKNIDVQIWRILLDSFAAEQAARMIAMDAATDNAQEMIHDLTLHYNKVRQAAITTEITEIVGGAEALRA